MRKVLCKYSCVFFFFIGSFVVFADGPPPVVPPSHECCEDFAPPLGQEDQASQEYLDCIANPTAYCTIPIDNSVYIYISIVAGVALASFVIARKIKN